MAESIPRRIIRFGNSSFVVSLPKEWISKNKIKKGDVIYFSENSSNELVIAAKEKAMDNESRSNEIKINGKTILELQRELTSSYINNYSEIIFSGKNILDKKDLINRIVNEKVGIEITEESNSQIVVRDMLDLESVSLDRSMRRLDNILKSMFEELLVGLRGPSFKEWNLKELQKADKEVNKMYFLIFKLIRRCQEDPALMKKFSTNNRALSNASWIIFHLENVGDEIKRISRFLVEGGFNDKEKRMLSELIVLLEKEYSDAINAYHNGDKSIAQRVANKKDHNVSLCEKFFAESTNPLKGSVAEKLKIITSSLADIAKIVAY